MLNTVLRAKRVAIELSVYETDVASRYAEAGSSA